MITDPTTATAAATTRPGTDPAPVPRRRAGALTALAAVAGGLIALIPASSASAAVCSQTLQYGSTGSCVSTLQTRLNQLGGHLTVDGDFGPATREDVLAFQGRAQIGFDGVVGPQTQSALNSGSANISGASVATINAAINAEFGSAGALFQHIAACESGPSEVAVNVNSNGTYDLGVFQINTTSGTSAAARNNLLHYQPNIAQAYSLYASRGTEPWDSSKSCWGKYA